MEQEERIQKYLSGALSEEAKKEFKKELSTNYILKKEFDEYKDVQEAFKIVEAKQLKSHFKKLDLKSNPFHKKMFDNKLRNVVYAASVAIALWFIFNTYTTTDPTYAAYFDTYPNVYEPIRRGNLESKASHAFQFYENNNFLDAEIAFEEVLRSEEDSNYRFYYAMCLIQNTKMELALKELKTLKLVNEKFLAEIYWYTALLYLQREDIPEVTKTLNELIELKSNYKNKESKEILEALKDR